jgi:Erv1 / Alr family
MFQMQFSTKTSKTQNAAMQQMRPLTNVNVNTMNRNPYTVSSAVAAPSNINSIIKDPSKPKTMQWGEPTWFLFHTLAQKVKEDTFPEIRKELLTVITTICNNLPCPDCANHATQYINSLNLNTIQTKKDLINMLFVFHNTVNARKGYPAFLYADLEPKYSLAITVPIVQHFMKHFDKSNYSGRVGINNFHKTRAVAFLKSWFSTKLIYFDT